jgi:His/Glu/Gln/Arg/opine family amino acid ABC transporter permease subunit
MRSTRITVELFAYSLIFATVLGLIIALMRMSRITPIRWFAAVYLWFLRGVPVLVVLFFTFFGLPFLGWNVSPMMAGVLGLGIGSAAYKAEIIRAGILSVDPGQWEAAEALAMTRRHTMRRIVLPQSIRVMVPPYMSNAILVLKATSLAAVITVNELTFVSRQLVNSTFRPIEILTAVGGIYLVLTSVLVVLQEWVERRFALKT